jgi:predicted ATPase
MVGISDNSSVSDGFPRPEWILAWRVPDSSRRRSTKKGARLPVPGYSVPVMADSGDGASGSVETLIFDRLADAGLPEPISDLLVAALLGDADLAAALSADGYERPKVQQRAMAAGPPAGMYLQAITVAGFRGIGAEAALRLPPGPGLTLVVGRNGSGKSSFAEAAELAVTGVSRRWSKNTAARTGWRNLHAAGASRITVGLAADGQAGMTTVVREWPQDAELEDAVAYLQEPGRPRQADGAGKWAAPLELYRPFLSYSELGTLVDGKPSEMYDALQAILGLDHLIDAERRLGGARKQLDDASKTAKQALPGLLSRLAGHSDERARQAEAALSGRRWELDAVEALAVGDQQPDGGIPARLQQVAALEMPTTETVAAAWHRLGDAGQRITELAGTPAAEAQRTAGLLTTAVAHYLDHPGAACPVCAGRPLDEQWAASARQEITRLADIAREADAAIRERDAAARALRTVLPSEPAVLAHDLGNDVDPAAARAAWLQWAKLAANASAQELAAGATGAFAALATAVTDLRDAASKELLRRSEAWQPMAAALAGWSDLARSSQRAASALAQVKQALAWLRANGQEIRDSRLAPFAEMSAQIWEMLRQESNVELGPIRLEGSSTHRRLSLDVTVDGVACRALGVMSQGELHALGLALFLPRATSPESPFRFLLIDDPVQSMDPAKVDGLARVLSQMAQNRQVIVFTHDDRLAEAVRRLQLPATVWEVVRRERSVVELKKNDDPVRCYLDDARALARTRELPEEASAVVVAGFCRSAIEAACHETVRNRRLAAGARHADVEHALGLAHTLHQVAALALFDDASRGDQVLARLRDRYGQTAVSAFMAAKAGPHVASHGNLADFVEDTARLTERLRP